MSFTSYSFLVFFFLCFFVYYVIPRKYQWVLLLAASYGFYFMAGVYYPIFLLTTSFTIYAAARRIKGIQQQQDVVIAEHKGDWNRDEKKAYKKKMKGQMKRWLLTALIINLGILAVLKYSNFAIENINACLGFVGSQKEISYVDIILPLGISFYTFQAVGYLLDVYWKKCDAQMNFFKFSLFVSFFPQLGQGPISRYSDLSETMFKEHHFDWLRVRFGLERILWGYFKKLVIADRIVPAVSMIVGDPEYYTGGFIFAGMIFYAIQLYADFTGGIDITIGIAQFFGIHITENFQRPFFSKNIAEYWRRWHITMGTWFRDYIFYPLSISGPFKKMTNATKARFGIGAGKRISIYAATIIVWLTTGIWHGASWNFVAWGFMNGVIILISQELEPCYARFHHQFPNLLQKRWYQGLQVIRTFLLMSCLRLFDHYQGITGGFRAFIHMFTQFQPSMLTKQEFLDLGLSRADYIIVATGVLLMFSVSMVQRRGSVREIISQKPYLVKYTVYVLLLFSVLLFGAYGIGYDASQFIYNQF